MLACETHKVKGNTDKSTGNRNLEQTAITSRPHEDALYKAVESILFQAKQKNRKSRVERGLSELTPKNRTAKDLAWSQSTFSFWMFLEHSQKQLSP